MELLDAENEIKDNRPIYSKIAAAFALISLSLMYTTLSYIPNTLKASDKIKPPPEWLAQAVLLSCLVGFIISVISFYKKEKSSFIKWFGGIINCALFIILSISIIVVGLN